MISTVAPDDFAPIYEVASCFVERDDGKYVLLLRLPQKSEGNKWGIPAGKVEPDEQPLQTIVREVREETGISFAQPPTLFATYFVRYPEYDYIFHVFHGRVPNGTVVATNPAEHQGHRWAAPRESLKLNLVKHQDDCVRFFYTIEA